MKQIEELAVYLWATPNSRRVSILFEELGLEYGVHPVNIRAREQFSPEILALNPYAKLPIVTWCENTERHVMSESGAILLHFGQYEPAILPTDGAAREAALVWFMMAMTSLGPMIGNAHHWTSLSPERSPFRLHTTQRWCVGRMQFLSRDLRTMITLPAKPILWPILQHIPGLLFSSGQRLISRIFQRLAGGWQGSVSGLRCSVGCRFRMVLYSLKV